MGVALVRLRMLSRSRAVKPISLDSRPRRERRPGIPYMRMCVHYPKKEVIRVFVDTVSKINRILFVF